MIKIKIPNIENLKKNHLNWYNKSILKRLEKNIILLEKNKTDKIEKYLNFLKKIGEKEDFAVLENEKIKGFIKYNNDKCLDWKTYNKEIDKINDKNIEFLKEKIEHLRLYLGEEDSLKGEIEKIKVELSKRFEITDKHVKLIEQKIKENKKEIFKTEFKELLLEKIEEIFKYKLLYDYGRWNRYEVLENLGVDVCPYCQRSYITKYEKKKKITKKKKEKEIKKKLTTAALDHFYSQDEYPFLAVSLFNFIPSCHVCNSLMKGAQETYDKEKNEERVIYPYLGEEFTGIFRSDGKIGLAIMKNDEGLFKIKLDKLDEKSQNTSNLFGLETHYEKTHNKYICDMIKNITKKPEKYRKSMSKLLSNDVKVQKQIEENFKKIILEPYKFKVKNEEPLAKLTKDILEEFGIDI
ncbi:MAG: hypothetical protein ACRC2N_02770 [Aeromonas sp.]